MSFAPCKGLRCMNDFEGADHGSDVSGIVAPPGAVHGFTTLEPDGARMVDIHSSPRYVATWVEEAAR
jgi:hypothetical protein